MVGGRDQKRRRAVPASRRGEPGGYGSWEGPVAVPERHGMREVGPCPHPDAENRVDTGAEKAR